MCGIVGYIGSQNAKEIIINGLKTLEYRGYDSAGICIVIDEKLSILKATGKLENLQNLLAKHSHDWSLSNIGIGHTRWATHGAVVTENAHPHGDEEVAVVHNGIIENAGQLKEKLQKAGFVFKSQTDSEVFFFLIKSFLKEGFILKDSVSKSFQMVEGNSAFVVMDKKAQEIIAIKRSAPLVCGDNHQTLEAFVSSDPYALASHVETLYFPDDEILCVLQKKFPKVQFFTLEGERSFAYVEQKQKKTFEIGERGNFEHYMLKEIYEQPTLIKNWYSYYMQEKSVADTLESIRKINPERIVIAACGTAWHAALLTRDYIERIARIPTTVELASELRYRNPVISPKTLSILISQSGETADTLAALELLKKLGSPTVAIVNVENSTLYRRSQYNLLIKAGIEVGVASTKAFTMQVLTGHVLALALAGKLESSHLALKQNVEELVVQIDELLKDKIAAIQEMAFQFHSQRGFIFTGRGPYFPIALESALKLKEIAYVHAEGYAAGELKHGPIALIDEEMVNLAIIGPELFEKTLSNIEEVKARKGKIAIIGPVSYNGKLITESDFQLELNIEKIADLNPLYVNVVTQLFAYYVAKFKGTDIDKPRNLAKSVTVE
jgi:glucosamine--fructose-6-phosphate aminotransferase (isomerizing)